MKAKPFATEADLCAAFLAWLTEEHPTLRAYSEWAGWDILVVYPEGFQLGIQAKLRLNAEVIGQASPSQYGLEDPGPDYRGVLVPDAGPLGGIASRLGLVVITGHERYPAKRGWDFYPDFDRGASSWPNAYDATWLDWNPERRHELPPTATDAIAGSPCPVSLTPWKLYALDVLAELAIKGTITTKRMKELGVNPARWLSCLWLEPAAERGLWERGNRCPKFDEQHPTAFAHALEKARQTEETP